MSEKLEFKIEIRRRNGDSVPVHGNKDIPKELLRKIIREDLKMSLEDFTKLYSKYKGNI